MKLLTAETFGAIAASNRVIMAPLTRMRAGAGDIPGPSAAEYYSQRASAGFIITEATHICPLGKGYPGTPGIYSDEQVAGWRRVTSAVHAKGGKIVSQLWHVGRISHSSHHPEEGLPVAPSAITPTGQVYTASWQLADYETPRALSESEIADLVASYRHAATQAKAAGFDGVEVHAANGYLLDQFLQDGSNHRTDAYGGTVANRTCIVLEVLKTVIDVWGGERVGIRLSPYGTFNDMSDTDTLGLFTYVIKQLNPLRLAYLHMIEPRATNAGGSDSVNEGAPGTAQLFRKMFKGKLISAGGYQRETAEEAVTDELADGIAFGRLFLANPDLPTRFETGAPLNRYDRNTFYGGGEKGYTDYPFLKS